MENVTGLFSSFMQNGMVSLGMIALLGLGGFFFFRKAIRAILSSVFGYRVSLDDYTLAIHNNRDDIYDNEVVRLSVNAKGGAIIFISFISALFSPYLFVGILGAYRYHTIKEKIANFKDFEMFPSGKTDDIIIQWLNTKTDKINLITNEMWAFSFILLSLGLYFGNLLLALVGFVLSMSVLLASLFITYNIYMYKTNYKQLQYFRALRLIETSALGGSSSLIFLSVLSLLSPLTPLAGFSPYLWILFLIKFVLGMVTSGLLKREDNVSQKHQEIENRNYKDIEAIASYPNPISQSRGYKWTTPLQMKFFQLEKEKSSKRLIHLDNYGFSPQMVNRSALRKNPLILKAIQASVKIKLLALSLAEQIVILGGMGSGKTEMIHYIVQQIHESKFTLMQSIIFNDIKGDFRQRFYREGKDHILSLFDARSSVWCMFTEMQYNIEAGTNFIANLFQSISGDEKDFFTAKAKQYSSKWIKEAYFATDNNIDAWEIFFSKIKAFELELRERDDRTNSSILSTIEIAVVILSIMKYQITVEKRKVFCIADFIEQKNVQLFLVNNEQYQAMSTPYLTGIWGAITSAMMSKEETKEHLILNVLDELLSMKIEDETRRQMMTATRSKGACNIIASQFLPEDKKIMQLLDSSRYALVTFNINEGVTMANVKEKLDEAEMLSLSSSPQNGSTGNGNGNIADALMNGGSGAGMLNILTPKKNNNSYALSNSKVVTSQELQSMPEFHHLTFIPKEKTTTLSEEENRRFFRLMAYGYEKEMLDLANSNEFLAKEVGILYLGYTPLATLNHKNKHSVAWDMREYYTSGEAIKKEEIKKLMTEVDPLKRYTEKEQFLHWYRVGFGENAEKRKAYISEHNLSSKFIAKVFEKFDENEEILERVMEQYGNEERLSMMDEFFALDDEGKYLFCIENDLIGAIIGLFALDDDFIAQKTLQLIKNEGVQE